MAVRLRTDRTTAVRGICQASMPNLVPVAGRRTGESSGGSVPDLCQPLESPGQHRADDRDRQAFRFFRTHGGPRLFLRNKLRGFTMGCLLKLIPLDRSARPYSLRTTLARCADFLNQGNRGLILFPEGTRSATGDIGPFKPGADLFSERLGIPVIPVCIDGTRRLMPKGRLFPKRGMVTILIGEMLWPRADRSIVVEVRSRILALKGNIS